jgi:hypothetical protein
MVSAGAGRDSLTTMLLVPRQLQRAGMTGDVPYYGGRLTPAHAYAIAHPPARPAPVPTGRASTGQAPIDQAEALRSLQHLLDAGVVTPEEYAGLRARLGA